MELIDGNKTAADIVAELKAEVAALHGRKPCIALVRVGDDPASVSYVKKKEKTAAEIGIESRIILPPISITQDELFKILDDLNADPTVDGILVQAPLPKHIDEVAVFRRVSAAKDVDGFNTINLGKVAQEDDTGFVACTPAGIMELLARSGTDLKGKHVVVLGRSLIVGKPVALLALQKKTGANGTVTICHSGTSNLPAITRQADVLIAAIGRPEFVTADMVKPGAVVIDVGINRVPDASKKTGYRLTGDVHFPSVSPLCSKITPVPGGVGPMTVAMLMKNTVKAYHLATAS
ncbi:MAG TPA: bifunctional 5,10-methylenetetrahydrofolate dehydrogenase/5,10-methenyltetrahydrofolate cyclohydrolase [Opitutaceae bacterium]|nr:bifunctional 5,10-methylenetetrahydrofolate dehydrogenase/5,10-methenyltetrahydrofolate cyclohydrolase [Opitutaceae bacterium]HOG93866.1 bifunctional 5,10-methylenetetrahydrofolate dehydrogenase/5,10-methenyltetrahydrofolate cyclohydrolase [Opitutaceae bacterium]HQL20826.1 bifunctional 5,10-methylenetetrahydrofolate dehydrogenase/5,10-methenyltetrahydrofolate cyclohydrolase [Opitutaceae bacterium]